MTAITVIVASSGRPTLSATLASILSQRRPGDQVLVDVNDDSPAGHRARNRVMRAAEGDFLIFLDDDDTYLNGALDVIRRACADDPLRVHLFRMRYAVDDRVLWREPELRLGNVSTQMVAVPNGGRRKQGPPLLPRAKRRSPLSSVIPPA